MQRRQADLGNGTYRNPILGGDYPDPSVLRVDDDFYMTHSSFNWAPGLLIWHSTDLVNWQPVAWALEEYDGDVWAPELIRHERRFCIYYYTAHRGNHVVVADDIRGPWSAPLDLELGHIDPGHCVGPNGRRYLHLSGGHVAELTPDGVRKRSEPRKVYDGWAYPREWRTEGSCLEGPKITVKDGWYYLISAMGGTAGPATSHMVVVARSSNPDGPWEDSPHNPLIRCSNRGEHWWSCGHGTLVEDSAGKWWCMYHGYENGYYTLGRQTLLEPVDWDDDGWPVAKPNLNRAAPIAKPSGAGRAHGIALSDDFSQPRLGYQWRFWGEHNRDRYTVGDGSLVLRAKGNGPHDTSPMACIPVDHAYEVEVDVEVRDGCEAGLILYYNPQCFAGVSFREGRVFVNARGRHPDWPRPVQGLRKRATLRLVNDHHEVDLYVRPQGGDWHKIDCSVETSGYHHNVIGGFLSLRVALAAYGDGDAVFRNFMYRARP
jgi:xylan 1,4-beta-xylosidase